MILVITLLDNKTHGNAYVSPSVAYEPVNTRDSSIPVTITAQAVITSNTDPEMNKVYSRAVGVRWISGIDIILSLILMIMSLSNNSKFWAAYFFGVCAIAGYYGAKHYNRCFVFVYIFYQILRCVNDFFLIFSTGAGGAIFYTIIFMIEIYLLQYTIKLYSSIGKLTPSKLQELQSGWTPVQAVVYYY